MAAAGAAAAAVVSVVEASPAAAGVDGDIVLGGNGNTTATATGIAVTGTSAPYGFGVTDNGAGSLGIEKPSLLAHAQGQNFTSALYALQEGPGTAVVVNNNAPQGIALTASASGPADLNWFTMQVFQGGQATSLKTIAQLGRSVDAISLGGVEPTVMANNVGNGTGLQAQSQGGSTIVASNTSVGTRSDRAVDVGQRATGAESDREDRTRQRRGADRRQRAGTLGPGRRLLHAQRHGGVGRGRGIGARLGSGRVDDEQPHPRDAPDQHRHDRGPRRCPMSRPGRSRSSSPPRPRRGRRSPGSCSARSRLADRHDDLSVASNVATLTRPD